MIQRSETEGKLQRRMDKFCRKTNWFRKVGGNSSSDPTTKRDGAGEVTHHQYVKPRY